MSAVLLLLALSVAVLAHHEELPGICSWESGGIGYCQRSAQGGCPNDRSFVIPQVSHALLDSYCLNRGYCCVEPNNTSSRPPRGQSCEDIGKTTGLCNGASVNWCRALKSSTVSTPMEGCEHCIALIQCQNECANTPGCDGFDYSLDTTQTNGRVCVLVTNAVPYFGKALEVTPEDSLWVTWINSFHDTCTPSFPAWYDLNLAIRQFTRSHTDFHAVVGATTVVTSASNIASIVTQIIDNLFIFENDVVRKLTSSNAQKKQAYADELITSIRERLATSQGTLNAIQWTTPSATYPSFTTYALVIRDIVYEPMLAADFAAKAAQSTSRKFVPQAISLPSNVIRTFRDSANQKVATFGAGVSCPEEGGCLGASACLLNNGLCKCRSHYEVVCLDTPFVGCDMRVVFLATCGNPDIEWLEDTFEYKVSGFGFSAYQEFNHLGKECQCNPVTSK